MARPAVDDLLDELGDAWLVAALQEAGESPVAIAPLDAQQSHRLVEVAYLAANGSCQRARVLHGVDDGSPFWVRVADRAGTVAEAIAFLVPAAVRRATSRGLDVRRQGDWFFVPSPRFVPAGRPRRVAYHRHTFERWSDGYARGRVTHPEHATVDLPGWHRLVKALGDDTLSARRPRRDERFWLSRIRSVR
jgi:hypothetical protein